MGRYKTAGQAEYEALRAKALAKRRNRCDTAGCKAPGAEVITYQYRGGERTNRDVVCTPCAEGYERRPVLVNLTRVPLAEYVESYRWGWRYAGTGSKGLDFLDRRGAPSAAYDGYHDFAGGRKMWHSLRCTNHDECEAGT